MTVGSLNTGVLMDATGVVGNVVAERLDIG